MNSRARKMTLSGVSMTASFAWFAGIPRSVALIKSKCHDVQHVVLVTPRLTGNLLTG